MGLLDMCCPKKPKKSLDYIIKWVEDADKTIKYLSDSIEEIKEMDLQKVFDDYARDEYDWSQVPEFDAKADKVKNAINGHLAALDSNGNLVDSGSSIDESIEEGNLDLATCNAVYVALQEKVNKVANATANNFASLDENGNIQDSRRKPADFADADHEHNYIADFSGSDNCGASVSVGEGDPGAGVISLSVKGNGQSTDSKTAEIDYSNIDNLNRAIADPVKSTDASPTYSDDKLITAGAVNAALAEKMNVLKEVELRYEEQLEHYTMHASADDIIPFIPFISVGPHLVVVKYTFDAGVDQTTVIRAIGSVNIRTTGQEEDEWSIELYVGDVLFGTTTIQAQDRQELEEAIENMFSDYAAGAIVTKISNHIFP